MPGNASDIPVLVVLATPVPAEVCTVAPEGARILALAEVSTLAPEVVSIRGRGAECTPVPAEVSTLALAEGRILVPAEGLMGGRATIVARGLLA
jgi:hypothetical protein